MAYMPRLAGAAILLGYALMPAAAHGQSITTLYSFTNGADGAYPGAELLYDNGAIVGTTSGGGTFDGNCKVGTSDVGCGTLFRLPSDGGALSTIYSFKGADDGEVPSGGIVRHADDFYGTTEQGGGPGDGTLFMVNSGTGDHTVLHDFSNAPDGAAPAGIMTKANDGYYGTTMRGGGKSHTGAVYRFDPATRTETIVYRFKGPPDGDLPDASMINVNGILYGTTMYGGSTGCGGPGCGAVFSFNPATHVETVLHGFVGGTDGATPLAALSYKAGTLYGVTFAGGSQGCSRAGCGVAFTIDVASGSYRILHRFDEKVGIGPISVLAGRDNRVYGTTLVGGTGRYGTLFVMNSRTGKVEVLWNFAGDAAGGNPIGLIYADNAFYGSTEVGGTGCGGTGCGTIFKFVP